MSELGPLIDRLLTLVPGSPEAEQQQHAVEHVLMNALANGGRDTGEKMVQSLAAHGYELERLDALPYMWRVVLPRPRVLELWFTGGNNPVVAALSYRAGAPWGTKRQKLATRRQTAFYSRYEHLCSLATGEKPPLGPDDRMILAVGEFEADVNNGGFGQYLDNKGLKRAREALTHLNTIGAKRTARWLSAALRAGRRSATLEGLNQRYYDKPEDLPSLVMRHLEKKLKR